MLNRIQHFTFLLLLSLFIFSCAKNQELETPPVETLEFSEFLPEISLRSDCESIRIPAGSTDALAQAIADICEGGKIYLEPGLHTETEPLTITKSIKLIGLEEAVLRIQAPALQLSSDSSTLLAMIPALHILDAPRTLIQNLTMEPLNEDGGAAIVLENSDACGIMKNNMSGFQSNILIEQSDRVVVMKNTIVSRMPWGLSGQPVAFGVLNSSGKSTYIAQNDISGALWAIFVSDVWGTIERNDLHDNNFGVNICGWRAAYILPNGTIPVKEESAIDWKIKNNTIFDNMNTGILVIDGSNSNTIKNNDLSGNGMQDIELTTITTRNGFVATASFENKVDAGSYPTITIKDCGNDNEIDGGVLIDTAVSICN